MVPVEHNFRPMSARELKSLTPSAGWKHPEAQEIAHKRNYWVKHYIDSLQKDLQEAYERRDACNWSYGKDGVHRINAEIDHLREELEKVRKVEAGRT